MSKILIPEIRDLEACSTVMKWVEANLGHNPEYDDSLQPTIDQWGFPWFRAGAVVYNYFDDQDKILMMHEARVQVKKIKDPDLKQRYLDEGHAESDWVDGDGGWNLPSGRLRPGESFEQAVTREVQEESGWSAMLVSYLLTRHSEKKSNQYVMPVFLARANVGPAQYATPETSEIGWFTVEEIRQMHKNGTLRSPEFVLESLIAYENYGKA